MNARDQLRQLATRLMRHGMPGTADELRSIAPHVYTVDDVRALIDENRTLRSLRDGVLQENSRLKGELDTLRAAHQAVRPVAVLLARSSAPIEVRMEIEREEMRRLD
jgi:hypothetical protein